MKFLCWLGFHKWEPTALTNSNKCVRCSMEQVVITGILESDLIKLREKGELSLQGYQNVIKKGYLEKSDLEGK